MSPIIIFVEGNIGTGKTTFLNNIICTDNIQILYEPVDEWKHIGILEKFYEDPIKYCYLFQSYCLHTRFKLFDQIDPSKEVVFIERSIMCDKNVFATTCLEQGFLTKIEMDIYIRWYYYYINQIPYKYTFLYLKCEPQTSYKRMKERHRDEENNISIDYLSKLNDAHNKWLISEIADNKVITIKANKQLKDKTIVNQYVNTLLKDIMKETES